ncbi:MAG: helix-turn-helix domain-containing protein [Armatimonadetes bacterium]|nr:helix-turn-helix domain-containing protein [Armatimonadota bacterium]
MAVFDRWLSAHMERRKIWSINRLAREAGLNAEHVGDWMLGRALPNAVEAAKLAEYLALPFRDVAEAAGFRDAGEPRGRLA